MHRQGLPLEGKLSAARLTDEVSKDTDCRVASRLAMTGQKSMNSYYALDFGNKIRCSLKLRTIEDLFDKLEFVTIITF